MKWTQLIDPLNNLTLSALVAAVPVFFIFWALIKKMKGYQASLITVFLAIGCFKNQHPFVTHLRL